MACYTKGGNENMQSIRPWEAVQRVKQDNSPLRTSLCKNISFSCSLQTQISKPGWGLQGKQEAKEVILELANRQQEQQLGRTTLSFNVPQSYAC